MRPAVYFANCLYKSGQTSGIQDTAGYRHDSAIDDILNGKYLDLTVIA